VRVTTSLAKGEMMVEVSDTGQGISPEFVPHMFDLFAQANPPTKGKEEGLGLGLAIVRKLIELQGGRVWANSDGIGLGSQFTFSLPLALTDAVARAPEPGPAHLNLPGPILIVEDSEDSLDMLTTLLTIQGCKVVSAN